MHNARAPRKSRSTCLTHLEFMVLASPRHHRRVTAGAEVAAKPFPTRESNKIRGATCSNVIFILIQLVKVLFGLLIKMDLLKQEIILLLVIYQDMELNNQMIFYIIILLQK